MLVSNSIVSRTYSERHSCHQVTSVYVCAYVCACMRLSIWNCGFSNNVALWFSLTLSQTSSGFYVPAVQVL